ncbi:neural cell adhesion molecule 2-like isoform X3 [Asterias rubens]|uniref:neural cell adhesion molecule 2-like isoform X3 n=1 Tax=Asterias rubens TaxID=7604 RepID=UPI0014555864|nr:neural cell adhesion molecule 2-like isoform X3 [Asterias rubens]
MFPLTPNTGICRLCHPLSSSTLGSMTGREKFYKTIMLSLAFLLILDVAFSEPAVSPAPSQDPPAKKAYQHPRQDMLVLGSTAIIETEQTAKCYKQYQGSPTLAKDVKRCLEASTTTKGAPGEPYFDIDGGQLLISKYEGDRNAKLTCVVRDLGNRNVVWMKMRPLPIMISINKILNAPDSRYSLETDNNGTFNLQIDDLRRADEGIYECQVNTDPQLAWSVTLQIVVQATVSDIVPVKNGKRDGRMFSFTYNETDSVELICVGDGSPSPSIEWRKWREPPQPPLPAGNVTLQIESINRSQAGKYECAAENGYNEAPDIRPVFIKVNYKPEVVALVTDVRAAAGEYRQLRCGVDAYPKAKYTWKKDGVTLDPPSGAIKNSPRKQTTIPLFCGGNYTSLVIVSVDPDRDYGTYSCHATNFLGTSVGYINLSGKPMAPVITSSPVGNRRHAYKLTWTQQNGQPPNYPGTIPVNYYQIRYRGWWRDSTKDRRKVYSLEDESNFLEEVMFPDSTKAQQYCVLNELRYNATYDIQLYAVNEYGDGDAVNLTIYTALEETTTPNDVAIQGSISSSSKGTKEREDPDQPAKSWQNTDGGNTAPSTRATLVTTLTSLIILLRCIDFYK